MLKFPIMFALLLLFLWYRKEFLSCVCERPKQILGLPISILQRGSFFHFPCCTKSVCSDVGHTEKWVLNTCLRTWKIGVYGSVYGVSAFAIYYRYPKGFAEGTEKHNRLSLDYLMLTNQLLLLPTGWSPKDKHPAWLWGWDCCVLC